MVSLVVMILIVTGVALYFGKREFDGPGPLSTSSTVVIKQASSVRDIGELLARRGMISNSRVFQIDRKSVV